MSEIEQLRAVVASLREQVLAKNQRFPDFMRRLVRVGARGKNGKVRVVFVAELDEKSTGTDADWIVSSSGESGFGRSGEQAFADLVESLEKKVNRG
jgi:hypothetical protein